MTGVGRSAAGHEYGDTQPDDARRQPNTPETPADSAAIPTATQARAAGEESPAADPLIAARERGRQAFRMGHKRRAVPGELRSDVKLAGEFMDGWDEEAKRSTT